MTIRPPRRRSLSVSVGVAAILAAALSGCSGVQGQYASDDDYDYGAACVEQETELRTYDDYCDDDRIGYGWYYLPIGGYAQAIGRRVSGGSFNPPPPGATAFRGGIPKDGAVVSRGGFGGKSGSVGG